MDQSQSTGSFVAKTRFGPELELTNEGFTRFKAAIQDIEFFAFENSFV
tara:strand:+ start:1021 stop:1164 length:144 start_codon:yes stop_codon:yes gene_type:complete